MKFTSIILALLLAPSKADLPASGNGSDNAAGRLGGKSTRMLEGGGGGDGGGNSNSCAAANPGIAVEQVFLSYVIKLAALEIVDAVGDPYVAFLIPSIKTFVTSNYDPDKDLPLYGPIGYFYLINRVLSEMSCEEYIEGQEASALFKLITSDLPFGPWSALSNELGAGNFGKEMASLASDFDAEEAAAYGFPTSTGSD